MQRKKLKHKGQKREQKLALSPGCKRISNTVLVPFRCMVCFRLFMQVCQSFPTTSCTCGLTLTRRHYRYTALMLILPVYCMTPLHANTTGYHTAWLTTASKGLLWCTTKPILYIVNSRVMARFAFSQLRQTTGHIQIQCNISMQGGRVHKVMADSVAGPAEGAADCLAYRHTW